MVYITVWSEFVEKSLQLYCAAPERSRYVWKYRPEDNEIVLKVTDDKQVLQYRTQQSADLKLLESWNYIMLKLTTTKNPDAATITAEIEEEAKAEREKKKNATNTKGKSKQ